MDQVRIGIIGLGNMGSDHARYLNEGKVKGAQLTAACDPGEASLNWARKNLKETVQCFESVDQFFESGEMDAIMICTPHYSHPGLAIRAFSQGLHVLIEKPAGVYTKEVREMNDAAKNSGKVFGIMYNQRTNPLYAKLRELVAEGELGELRRFNWIITDWYRPQAYYNSGGWRATWSGEGGGVLINQCPHQLDLWQWILGTLPARIRAFCSFGKHRDIEVEDDVTAYVEYENGASGVFITTTGEAPGTNRLEIAGDRGRAVIENEKLSFSRLRVSEGAFNKETTQSFDKPECWECEIPIEKKEEGHPVITQNFVDAILQGKPLIAPGEEGIKGLTLSNAMYLSTWTDDWVNLPIDEDLYYKKLQEQIDRAAEKNSISK